MLSSSLTEKTSNEKGAINENNSPFNFDQYNESQKYKIDCLWNSYKLAINVELCFYCLKKATIVCNFCNCFYYCSEEHRVKEYHNYHFFECHLVQFLKELKTYKGEHVTSKFLII